jgi:hypothetical protein
MILLLASYYYGDVTKEVEKGGACGTSGGEEKYKVLTGKPEGKTLLKRLKCRWEDNIKIGCVIVDCIDLVQGRHK